MSIVLRAKVRHAYLLQIIASSLSSVNKSLHLVISQTNVEIYAINPQYQVWGHFLNEAIFNATYITQGTELCLESSGDALAQALHSNDGRTDVELTVVKGKNDDCSITVRMESGALSTMNVQQRFHGTLLSKGDLRREPDIGTGLYCGLTRTQVKQMIDVCEHYASISEKILVAISRETDETGLLVFSSDQEGVFTETEWDVQIMNQELSQSQDNYQIRQGSAKVGIGNLRHLLDTRVLNHIYFGIVPNECIVSYLYPDDEDDNYIASYLSVSYD